MPKPRCMSMVNSTCPSFAGWIAHADLYQGPNLQIVVKEAMNSFRLRWGLPPPNHWFLAKIDQTLWWSLGVSNPSMVLVIWWPFDTKKWLLKSLCSQRKLLGVGGFWTKCSSANHVEWAFTMRTSHLGFEVPLWATNEWLLSVTWS